MPKPSRSLESDFKAKRFVAFGKGVYLSTILNLKEVDKRVLSFTHNGAMQI
jgi:hypothetical protein